MPVFQIGPREEQPGVQNLVRLLHDIANSRFEKKDSVKSIAINDLAWSSLSSDRSAYHNALMSFSNVTSLFLQNIHCSRNELFTLLRSHSDLETLDIQGLQLDDDLLESWVLRRVDSRLHLNITGQSHPVPGTVHLFGALASLITVPLMFNLDFGRIDILEEIPYLDIGRVSDLKFTVYLDKKCSYHRCVEWWGHVIGRHGAQLRKITINIQAKKDYLPTPEDVPFWRVLDQGLCDKSNLHQQCFQISLASLQSRRDYATAVMNRLPSAVHRYGASGRISWCDGDGRAL
ncbi:hypothetical protein DFS33DRAFT_1385703 [Desarmillaria ectypa]|nr:hypothetical protein DFS33DRAFT_1385703 [Desarmillaria ectypa]